MTDEPGAPPPAGRPRALAAADAFVLRRVAEDRFVAVGGQGLGQAWAGAVEVRPSEAPPLRRAATDDVVVRVGRGRAPARVLGPLWAAEALLVPVQRATVVVLASRQGSLGELDDDVLRAEAQELAEAHLRVPPAKRRTDELDALHAVQRLLASAPADVREAAAAVVEVSMSALACEVGGVVLPRRGVTLVRGSAAPADVATAAAQLLAQGPPVLAQDAAGAGVLDADLVHALDARSVLALPLTDDGVLLLAHTGADPRGFTHRCQQLSRRLIEAAETILLTAEQREDLHRRIAQASVPERRDAVTGLGNRLSWDAALERRRAHGAAAAVMVLAVGGLQVVTDELGEHAADELLRASAEVVTDSVRSVDEVARISDDEIAVLLDGADDAVCAWVQSRIAGAADRHPLMGELPLSLTAGWALIHGGDPTTRAGDDRARADEVLELARARARQRAETP